MFTQNISWVFLPSDVMHLDELCGMLSLSLITPADKPHDPASTSILNACNRVPCASALNALMACSNFICRI